MRVKWEKPPRAIAVAGSEHYIRNRWVRHTLLDAYREGFEVVFASSDVEVNSALSMAETFGLKTVVVAPLGDITLPTVEGQVASSAKTTSLLLECVGELNPKKHLSVEGVPKKYRVEFNWPSQKKDQTRMAERFVLSEASRWLGNDKAISLKIAERLVTTVGADLGTLSWEISKAAALARSRGDTTITIAHLRATLRPASATNLQPLRTALMRADVEGVAKALRTIKSKSTTDPTMLLLRSRGGPADLAYQWLHASLLVERGSNPAEIATVIGVPGWAVEKTILPAVRKWGKKSLQNLVRDLAHADRGTLQGVPSPWVACQSALLRGCLSVGI